MVGAAVETTRDRRKAETRARLLAASERIFVEHGFLAARPQDIARAADVAVGTFYVHFQDKRAAFLAVTERAAHELMARLHARTEGREIDFGSRLRASLEGLLEFAAENPGLLAACFADAAVISAGLPRGASLRERLSQNLAEGLARGMARGELRSDYDPAIVAAGIVGLVQHSLLYGGETDREILLENVTRFCARALVRPPA